jgi:hypothetical protein
LVTRIEEQRTKIRALQVAAEERRRTDQLRIQEQSQKVESRRQELRQQRLPIAISIEDRRILFYEQEELRRTN